MITTKLLRMYYRAYHCARKETIRALALNAIEYAIGMYGDTVTMTKPEADRLVVVKQSPIERKHNGATITFHEGH